MNILDKPFWVVTQPTPASEFNDICFECTFAGLKFQYLGGLQTSDIHGIYTSEAEATRTAIRLLDQQDTKG